MATSPFLCLTGTEALKPPLVEFRDPALKLIYWERNGFALWSKRIEGAEKYHWPRMLQEEAVTVTTEQLNWLLDGYDIWTQPHRMLRFQHAS